MIMIICGEVVPPISAEDMSLVERWVVEVVYIFLLRFESLDFMELMFPPNFFVYYRLYGMGMCF